MMIVVVIVGLLSALAVQTFIQIKRNSQATILINDFRQYRDAFNTYALETGGWPAQSDPGVVPPDLANALRGFDTPSVVGGNWQWVNDGTILAVSLVDSPVIEEIIEKVDTRLDDGDLTTGAFRQDGTSYQLILLETP